MEIKSGQLATQYQHNLKTEPKPEQDSSAHSVVSSSDTLSISPEAQVLFSEGGGHPDRPKKEN
ncbi:hypothetical protein [Colwellia sp. Bg11-28]|uniref:hypothetical protein n=1 Tax=Colwellia sp. Bg11-28 TaxID=2058305 RepID=UPI000C3202DE|nr:hypothetical protein [Colwellia sp. Bg11-28]PKH86231.1 hypothetical protein CXF79_16050 [Colwellia sp. Bg11-28]